MKITKRQNREICLVKKKGTRRKKDSGLKYQILTRQKKKESKQKNWENTQRRKRKEKEKHQHSNSQKIRKLKKR